MDNRETGLRREESESRRNPQVSSALVTAGQKRKLRDPRIPQASSQKDDPKLTEIRHRFFSVFPHLAGQYYQTKGTSDWRWLEIMLSIIRAVMHGTEDEKLAARASVNTLKTLSDDVDNNTIRVLEKGVLHVERRVKQGQADKIDLETKINEKKVAITDKEEDLFKLKQCTEELESALLKIKEETKTSETCLIRLKNEKQAMEGKLEKLKHKKYHLEFNQIVRT